MEWFGGGRDSGIVRASAVMPIGVNWTVSFGRESGCDSEIYTAGALFRLVR
jgi:hypothetical protein